MKYLKYYISPITIVLAIYTCSSGAYHSTLFFIGFSLFIILGDIFVREDANEDQYSHVYLLDLPMYINFPLLMILVAITVFVLSNDPSIAFADILKNYLNIDLVNMRQSMTLSDSIFLTALTGLFIGIMGTVPGHELVHRKKSKFDMFMGNWLLAFSWDCAFAVEHVYGHHKHVGLPSDPATAKRGENIYFFILRAIIKEQKDAWNIELSQARRREQPLFSIHNSSGVKNRWIPVYSRSFGIDIFSKPKNDSLLLSIYSIDS